MARKQAKTTLTNDKVRMISAGAEDGLQNHWGRDAQRLDSAFCTICFSHNDLYVYILIFPPTLDTLDSPFDDISGDVSWKRVDAQRK